MKKLLVISCCLASGIFASTNALACDAFQGKWSCVDEKNESSLFLIEVVPGGISLGQIDPEQNSDSTPDKMILDGIEHTRNVNGDDVSGVSVIKGTAECFQNYMNVKISISMNIMANGNNTTANSSITGEGRIEDGILTLSTTTNGSATSNGKPLVSINNEKTVDTCKRIK